MVTSYGYDSRHRVQSITHRQGEQGPVLAQYIYGYDAKGQRTSATETEGDLVRERRYDYDVLDRLIRETLQFTDTEGQAQAVERTYRYDSVGNRTEAEVRILQAGAVVRHEVTTATYDANSRLTREQVQDQRTGAVTIRDYAYDANGSPVSVSENGVTTTYAYDGDNRLTALSARGTAAAYGYDADGNRIAKTVNGQHTRFALDASQPYVQVLEATDSQGRQRRVTHGLGPVAERHEGQTRWVLKDVQQSSRVLTNAAAQAEASLVYTAFGEAELGSATGVAWLHRHDGEQLDEETGDYYLRARYMRPGLGRFTQKDTWTGNPNNPVTLNQYVFADGNPVAKSDPSGRSATFIEQNTALAVFALALAATTPNIILAFSEIDGDAAFADGGYQGANEMIQGAMGYPEILQPAVARARASAEQRYQQVVRELSTSTTSSNYVEWHHPIPVYLCGAVDQMPNMVPMRNNVHRWIHSAMTQWETVFDLETELQFNRMRPFSTADANRRAMVRIARDVSGRAGIADAVNDFYSIGFYELMPSLYSGFWGERPGFVHYPDRNSRATNCRRNP